MSEAAEGYLGWLGSQIRASRNYWGLLRIMLEKEFVWLVANDDNRIGDAMEIRKEFTQTTGVLYEGPCSVLEVLIGLSRRLEFQSGGEAAGWAYQLLENLELHKLYDPLGPRKTIKAEEILETLVWRTYAPDGTGGFFPLAWPNEDQTKVEIWYQMAAYVEEIHPEY
jgi:hypothetical protein